MHVKGISGRQTIALGAVLSKLPLADDVIDLNLDAPIVRVEIPNDLQAIKKSNMALALDWRLKTRDLFEAYFARGYEAIDFVRAGEVWGPERARYNWYILRRS